MRAAYEAVAGSAGGERCKGEAACDQGFQEANDRCLMEYGGELVNIGKYNACLDCKLLATKPRDELMRMVRIVPDARLEKYRKEAESEDASLALKPLIDRVETYARRHRAGDWSREDFGQLPPLEYDLLLFWLDAEPQFERASAEAKQEAMMQALLAMMAVRGK